MGFLATFSCNPPFFLYVYFFFAKNLLGNSSFILYINVILTFFSTCLTSPRCTQPAYVISYRRPRLTRLGPDNARRNNREKIIMIITIIIKSMGEFGPRSPASFSSRHWSLKMKKKLVLLYLTILATFVASTWAKCVRSKKKKKKPSVTQQFAHLVPLSSP